MGIARINIGDTSWMVVIDPEDEIARDFGSYVDPSKNQIIIREYKESSIIHEIVNVVMLENALKPADLNPYETVLSAMYMVREKLGAPPKKVKVKVATAYCCSNCDKILSLDGKRPGIRICQSCGQPLDWSEE